MLEMLVINPFSGKIPSVTIRSLKTEFGQSLSSRCHDGDCPNFRISWLLITSLDFNREYYNGQPKLEEPLLNGEDGVVMK